MKKVRNQSYCVIKIDLISLIDRNVDNGQLQGWSRFRRRASLQYVLRAHFVISSVLLTLIYCLETVGG